MEQFFQQIFIKRRLHFKKIHSKEVKTTRMWQTNNEVKFSKILLTLANTTESPAHVVKKIPRYLF